MAGATCKAEGCQLPQEEAGLCFAHKAAVLIRVIAAEMAGAKVMAATVGGVSVTLHPAAIAEHEEKVRKAEEEETRRKADLENPVKAADKDKKKVRAAAPAPGIREMEIGGRKVADEDLHGRVTAEDVLGMD